MDSYPQTTTTDDPADLRPTNLPCKSAYIWKNNTTMTKVTQLTATPTTTMTTTPSAERKPDPETEKILTSGRDPRCRGFSRSGTRAPTASGSTAPCPTKSTATFILSSRAVRGRQKRPRLFWELAPTGWCIRATAVTAWSGSVIIPTGQNAPAKRDTVSQTNLRYITLTYLHFSCLRSKREGD